MLRSGQIKKRKREEFAAEGSRTSDGSAFIDCPICCKQVPLLTINVHLGSRSCLQSSQQSKAEQPKQVSAERLGTGQTVAVANSNLSRVVLQPHQVSSVPFTRSAPQAAVAHHAALRSDILTRRSSCWNPALTQHHTQQPQMHVAANGLPISPCNGTLSDALFDCSAPAAEFLPIPHADLIGEYRIPEFVTEQEGRALVHMVDTAAPQWKDSTFNGKHRGKRWGAEMDLSKRTVVEGPAALPPELIALIKRMQQICVLRNFEPNEANAIEYRKASGHWLKPHVDDRQLSTDKIVTLSLVGSAVMVFNCKKKGHTVSVELPPRTLQVITKEARYMYSHGIANQSIAGTRRVSITFRQSPLKA